MAQHLALPIVVTGAGRLATVEQDSAADVAQSVALLVDTRPGERRAEPGYGVPDPLFGGVDLAEVTEAIVEWEDRADLVFAETVARGVLDSVQVNGDTTGPAVLDADDPTSTETGA